MLGGVLDTLTTCETDDRVDVQSLVGNHAGSCLNLACLQLTSHHGKDVTILALMANPILVLIVANGRETYLHTQLGSLEKQLLHYLSGVCLVHADKDTQREGRVDVGLADVENLCIVFCKDTHHRCSESWAILSCNSN